MTPGQRGEAVRDLQRRLGAAGFPVAPLAPGTFCDRTRDAVAAFQTERGLRTSGSCDADTWRAIVEASFTLGDRLLMLVAPNLRGDDVSELQASLARIGFDPGHNDGIFGPDTAQALRDFQHNSGVTVDGVCGPSTVLALQVLTRQTGTGPGITAIKELETLRATARSLAELRVVVGQFGGLSSLVRQLVKVLRLRSATVVATDEPEASVQAATANRFRATAFVAFEVYGEPATAVQYFSAPQFESTAGLQLAERICTALAASDSSLNPELRGMRLQVLRETRMPAVLVSLSTADHALDHTPAVVNAIVDSLEAWVASGH